MGKKTSVYLTDQLAASVEESGLPLATLIRRGLGVKLRLVETSTPHGDFVTHWYCDVPAKDARFRVLDDEWRTGEDGVPVREIYEIEITDPGASSAE